MNIVVLHEAVADGARADEADVLDQVAAVRAALSELGHRHSVVAMTADLAGAEAELKARAPDAVFNLVESIDGSGRALDLAPELLERLGLPFTGSGKTATRAAASKLASKRVLAEHRLPSPRWFALDQLRRGVPVPSDRYIMKSVFEHGSLGLEADCVVETGDAAVLRAGLEQRLDRFGGSAFAESYVHGREWNLALLAQDAGVEALPPAEIRFAAPGDVQIVGYRAKWSPGSAEDTGTPRSFEIAPGDRALVANMQALAKAAWTAFGLAGYARIDFRVDRRGRPWIIDVNTNPCLSPDAGFAAAVQRAGMTFAGAIERILASAFVHQPR